MATRVSLRRVGSLVGKMAPLSASMPELLVLATKKLQLDSPATRIFSENGPRSGSLRHGRSVPDPHAVKRRAGFQLRVGHGLQ